MQKIFRCLAALTFVAAASSTASAQELKLTLNNGLVTVIADEVPVSRILSEWAKVGQTKIVNGEKLMTVVSLQLVDMPERKALDIILRTASGYMAAERPAPVAGASAYDRIMILPFSKAPAAPPVSTSSVPQPFSPPRTMMQPQPMDDEPVLPPGVGPQQPAGNQPNLPGVTPAGQQPQLTAPRPGQLPAPGPAQPVPFGGSPAAPPGVKPPGGGGGATMAP
jgi:hypothetical protein